MNTETITGITSKQDLPSSAVRQYRVKQISNNNVVDCEGKTVGKLVDMVAAYPSGRITFVVMSCGGLLGFGALMFVVPWQNVELDIKNQEFVLSITCERLKKAPSFSGSTWPDLHDKAWMQNVLKFYENDSKDKPK